jgi:hypothetical protein
LKWTIGALLLLLTLSLSIQSVGAQAVRYLYCQSGEYPRFEGQFAVLEDYLVWRVGTPRSCRHTVEYGRTEQWASVGILWGEPNGAASFFNGYQMWTLSPDGTVQYRSGDVLGDPGSVSDPIVAVPDAVCTALGPDTSGPEAAICRRIKADYDVWVAQYALDWLHNIPEARYETHGAVTTPSVRKRSTAVPG